MATVRVDAGNLYVELSTLDALLAIHGSFTIPLSGIAGASVDKPPGFWETLKFIGTAWPWPLKMAGTFFYHHEQVFFDYQGDEDVLVVDLKPGASGYRHLFVHVDQPDTPNGAAHRITAALP